MISTGNSSNRLRPFKPTPFGRFTLLLPLATGGMGEIFLARLEGTKGFERLCVIKKILPQYAEEPQFVERFINEARILVKLSHGAIAQVLDVGVEDDAPFLALEFVDGKDLRKIATRMKDKGVPLPLTFLLHVMIRVLDGLAYAHRKRDDQDQELSLVHRDVSPQNVLVSYEGEVKVIDFGLAKSTLNSTKTNPSIILGKFLYMSPEQARHQKVDRRSDLYAVGLCLYELICGTNPFDLVAPGELIHAVGSPKIRPLNEVEPLCPPALSALVMKALAVDPGARFQTAEEFRGKLTAMLVDIDPGAGPETASKFMREAFAGEYQQERRLLATFRELTLPTQELQRPKVDELTPSPGPRPSSKPPTRGEAAETTALSFQPTPRTHAGPVPLSAHESATVPGVFVDVGAMSVRATRPAAAPVMGVLPSPSPLLAHADDLGPEPVTAQGPVVHLPAPAVPHAPETWATNTAPLRPAASVTPWDSQEKTVPSALAFDPAAPPGGVSPPDLDPPRLRESVQPTREHPVPVITVPSAPRPQSARLPSVMVDPIVATDPGQVPVSAPKVAGNSVRRLPVERVQVQSLASRPVPQVTEVLPRALAGLPMPDLMAEPSRTTTPRAQWMWLLVPLAAGAIVAALLLTMNEKPEPAVRGTLRSSPGNDSRRREMPARGQIEPGAIPGAEAPTTGNH